MIHIPAWPFFALLHECDENTVQREQLGLLQLKCEKARVLHAMIRCFTPMGISMV